MRVDPIMTAGDPNNRLQPALLDRLTDDGRSKASPQALRPAAARYTGWRPRDEARRAADATPPAREHDAERAMSKADLRQAVLRDLGAVFNAVQPLGSADLRDHPRLADTVLNFGLPPLAGQLASKLDLSQLERTIRQTILRFEPRILGETLRVRALEATSVLDTHNVLEFEISGHLWSQPVPLEILLRTQVDLEAGQVRVRDAAASPFGSDRQAGAMKETR